MTEEMFSKADAYERFMGRWSRDLSRSFVTFCDVREGDEVLDVGSGTGSLSLAVCAACAPGGRVTGIDPSEDYVAQATANASAFEAPARFQVGNATSLPFADASFDKAISSLVLNFVQEPEKAVREMMRVTKPGGVVAAEVWDYGGGMEMLRVFWDEAVALDPDAKRLDEANMPLCKKGELAALFAREGLQRVTEAELTTTLSFASFDDYWQPFLLGQGPAGAYATSLSEDARGALERRLRQRIFGGATDRPFEMRARAWAVRAMR
jgi:ubiquinone/menaquinone biosynthesis C-methylase UbiE